MRIGVKYCGGCNPFYDRKAEVEKLERNLKNISFELVQHGESYGRVLLVCGCPRACIWKHAVSGKYAVSGENTGSRKNAVSGECDVPEKIENSGTMPKYLLVKSREDFIKIQELLQGEK